MIFCVIPEVGIYKRKQESKKTRKQELDQESDQENKKTRKKQELDQEKKKVFFLDRFLGRVLVFLFFDRFLGRVLVFLFFLLSCFLINSHLRLFEVLSHLVRIDGVEKEERVCSVLNWMSSPGYLKKKCWSNIR